MSLMIQIHTCHDEDYPFMEALRSTCVENFMLDDAPGFDELQVIRTAAIENDAGLSRLIELKPEHAASYRRQWQEAEDDLEKRVVALRIPGVRAPSPNMD